MHFRKSKLFLLLLLALWLPITGRAQTTNGISLRRPDLSRFPEVEFFFYAQDEIGEFLPGLKTGDLTIIEDGKTLAPNLVQQQRTGVQFVAAINPGTPFAQRDAQGQTRYETLVQSLRNWAIQRNGSTVDDLSLVVANGPGITHSKDPQQWATVLQADNSNLRQATPNLDIALQAVEIAADTLPKPGMNRVVLLITPPMENIPAEAYENLAQQAVAQDVRLVVWMVAAAGNYSTPAAEALAQLAAQTGGAFWPYIENETPPSPENYLESLRVIYQVRYTSQIQGGGAHSLAVEVQQGELLLASDTLSYEIDVQPPNPAFVAPPLEIRRSAAPDASEAGELLPGMQEIQIVVDFPDGKPRMLRRTTLFVDGVVAAQNETPPFEFFSWDLRDYTSNSEHLLRVEAEDVLGLAGSSIETLVRIQTPQAQAAPWSAALTRNIPILVALALVIAGAGLVLVLILGGRLRPVAWGTRQTRRSKVDPVTQPVNVAPEPSAPRAASGWSNRLHWPQRSSTPKPVAFLVSIADQAESPTANMEEETSGRRLLAVLRPGRSTPEAIPVPPGENILGRSPAQANIVLDDASIEALHARLRQTADGSFRLSDAGTIAGTWVNYTPVSKEGTRLEHDDLVHIGRLGFRFQLRHPVQVRRPVIITHEVDKQVEEKPEVEA